MAVAVEFGKAVDDASDYGMVLDAGHTQHLGTRTGTATVDCIEGITGNTLHHDGLERGIRLNTGKETVLAIEDVAIFVKLDGFTVELPLAVLDFFGITGNSLAACLPVVDTSIDCTVEKFLCTLGRDSLGFAANCHCIVPFFDCLYPKYSTVFYIWQHSF